MRDTLDIKIGGANTHFKTNDRSICLSFIFPFHNSSVEETMDGKEQDQVSMIRWHDEQGLNIFVKMETIYIRMSYSNMWSLSFSESFQIMGYIAPF